MLDDAYLWSTNDDAAASILDGDNEVEESTGALICSDCQVQLRYVHLFVVCGVCYVVWSTLQGSPDILLEV